MSERPHPSPDHVHERRNKLVQYMQGASFVEWGFKLQFGLPLSTDLSALSAEDVERLLAMSEEEKRLNFERGILSLPDES